jgi:hypothetical protein
MAESAAIIVPLRRLESDVSGFVCVIVGFILLMPARSGQGVLSETKPLISGVHLSAAVRTWSPLVIVPL